MGEELSLRALVWTLAVVAAACALRILLDPVLFDRAAFLFALAVMISAVIGGWPMGLLATGLAGIGGFWLFVGPFSPGPWIQDVVQSALFLVTGSGISMLSGELRKARLYAEEEARNASRMRSDLSELLESIPAGFQALDADFRPSSRIAPRSASQAASGPKPSERESGTNSP